MGWTESAVRWRLASLPASIRSDLTLSWRPGSVLLAFDEKREDLDEPIVRLFGADCLPRGVIDPQEAVIDSFRVKGWTLACAESCTGGLLGGVLTSLAGSSDVFLGSAVCYSNEAKRKVLAVPETTLASFGAVSAETALAMAEGARDLYGTSLAISVTGIAGPGGGSEDKPVGTVWFGLARLGASRAVGRLFAGCDRGQVRSSTVAVALHLLWLCCREE